MFKVNNKDTILVSLLLFTYFAPCSTVSFVNFEQVNASWELIHSNLLSIRNEVWGPL